MKPLIPALAAAALTLTACSSSDTNTEETTPPEQTSAAADTATLPEDDGEPMDSDHVPEGAENDDPFARPIETIPAGQPGLYSVVFMGNNEPTDIEITYLDHDCDSAMSAVQRNLQEAGIDRWSPRDGYKVCELDLNYHNVGKTPGGIPDPEGVIIDGAEYAAFEDMDLHSLNTLIWLDQNGGEMNPGDSTDTWLYFQIPEGKEDQIEAFVFDGNDKNSELKSILHLLVK